MTSTCAIATVGGGINLCSHRTVVEAAVESTYVTERVRTNESVSGLIRSKSRIRGLFVRLDPEGLGTCIVQQLVFVPMDLSRSPPPR